MPRGLTAIKKPDRPVIPSARNEYFQEVTALRERVSELEEELRLYKEEAVNSIPLDLVHRWKLTGKETALLAGLVHAPHGFLTKDQIYYRLYGLMQDVDAKIVDVFVCKIRAKLERADGEKIVIDTVWGRGYKLAPESRQYIEKFLPSKATQPSPLVELVKQIRSQAVLGLGDAEILADLVAGPGNPQTGTG